MSASYFDNDPLARLALEKRRTLFMFYGYLDANGERSETAYFKQAYSLQQALVDLLDNTGTADLDLRKETYLVLHVILTEEDDADDPVVHVQLQHVQLA